MRTRLASLVIVALVAACSAAAPHPSTKLPTPPASSTIAAAPSGPPGGGPPLGSAAPPSAPTNASPTPAPSLAVAHAAPDLEMLIAVTVSGKRLATGSAIGNAALVGRPTVAAYAGRVGATAASDVALATASDPGNAIAVSIIAVRVVGASSHDPLATFIQVMADGGQPWTTTTMSSRQVAKGSPGQLAYASGDTLVVVTASDDALAAAALSALP